jgi:hypothetical protein
MSIGILPRNWFVEDEIALSARPYHGGAIICPHERKHELFLLVYSLLSPLVLVLYSLLYS